MVPASAISSTRYALAAEGQEYAVFQPEDGEFAVELPAGDYIAEWFSLAERTWTDGTAVVVDEARGISFTPPFAGPAVLHLSR
jgi:hypothetical protein